MICHNDFCNENSSLLGYPLKTQKVIFLFWIKEMWVTNSRGQLPGLNLTTKSIFYMFGFLEVDFFGLECLWGS